MENERYSERQEQTEQDLETRPYKPWKSNPIILTGRQTGWKLKNMLRNYDGQENKEDDPKGDHKNTGCGNGSKSKPNISFLQLTITQKREKLNIIQGIY